MKGRNERKERTPISGRLTTGNGYQRATRKKSNGKYPIQEPENDINI